MHMRQPILRQQALLLSAALVLLAAAPYAVAQATPAGSTATAAAPSPAAKVTVVVLNNTAPAAGNAAASTASADGTGNGTTLTLSSVDQPIPSFSGIRSCLPFNILLAAAHVGGLENNTATDNSTAASSGSSSGRIMIQAEYAVINQTVASIEDGVLTLSLAGGFESRQPINFTVVMPAASQLRYVANYGSGTVVLGPGHNTTLLRLAAHTIGTIQGFNVTADSVTLISNGVLGSFVSGAFKQAQIITNVGTGSVALTSTTPVKLTVKLGGIMTVVADVPDGSNITGTASGLSKVQFTNGSCYVSGQSAFPFPAPSIFGPGGFGFAAGNAQQQANSKCQRVQTGQLQPVVAMASNPRWTCGVVVDGQLSCQQGANATGQVLQWNIQNTTAVEPALTAPVVAPPPNVGTQNSATSAGLATNTAAAAPPAAANSDNTGSNTASTAGNAGVNAAGSANNGGDLTAAPATAPAAPAASGGASLPPAAVAEPLPAPPSPNAGRKMLQDIPAFGFGLPAAFQAMPMGTTTTNPEGTITTGSYTSGPGASSYSSGSVGDTTQTTTSQGGSAPTTTLSTGGVGSNLFNPVVVPFIPPENFAADNATTSQTANTAGTSTTPSTPSGSSAAGAGLGSVPNGPSGSVSVSTTGPSGAAGVAVVNTVCSSRQQSLSMLVQPAAEPQHASVNLPVRPSDGAAANGGNNAGTGAVGVGIGAGNFTSPTP